MSDYRRLIGSVRPHVALLAGAIGAMVVLSAATGAFSWLVGPMFQFVFKGGSLDAAALRSALPFLRAPETQDTFLKQGVAAAPGSPEELGDWVRAELARWTPIIQAAGIKAD